MGPTFTFSPSCSFYVFLCFCFFSLSLSSLSLYIHIYLSLPLAVSLSRRARQALGDVCVSRVTTRSGSSVARESIISLEVEAQRQVQADIGSRRGGDTERQKVTFDLLLAGLGSSGLVGSWLASCFSPLAWECHQRPGPSPRGGGEGVAVV